MSSYPRAGRSYARYFCRQTMALGRSSVDRLSDVHPLGTGESNEPVRWHAQGSIVLWPALAAGLLVTATHVPPGTQVLARGIVFIDLAIAQIAGCGVILADRVGFEAGGATAQIAAPLAALAGAFLLTWTERRWPEVQKAIIGVVFVMAATAGVLLLASNVHGSEHLRDLLVGQILWVAPRQLAIAACVYAAMLALWFGVGARLGRVGFYVLFAVVVTLSVQLVGVYLVFATLIVPPLATRRVLRGRLARAWAIGIAGYAIGIALSAAFDVPTGPLVVWTLVLLGIAHFGSFMREPSVTKDSERANDPSVRSAVPDRPRFMTVDRGNQRPLDNPTFRTSWTTAHDEICATRRRILLASFSLVPFLLAAPRCYGEDFDDLRGTFSLIEDGRVIEEIRIERDGSGFVLSRMHGKQQLPPVPVAPVSRQRLEAMIRQPVNIAFEGLGDDYLAVLKVPKGWRIGSFVCSTGYLLATTLGPAELHKL